MRIGSLLFGAVGRLIGWFEGDVDARSMALNCTWCAAHLEPNDARWCVSRCQLLELLVIFWALAFLTTHRLPVGIFTQHVWHRIFVVPIQHRILIMRDSNSFQPFIEINLEISEVFSSVHNAGRIDF